MDSIAGKNIKVFKIIAISQETSSIKLIEYNGTENGRIHI